MEITSTNGIMKFKAITKRDHVLLHPEFYIGTTRFRQTEKLWVYENDKSVYRSISYLPGLCQIFEEVLIYAADNKQRDTSMDSLEVTIDPETNTVSVYNNGYGVPVEKQGDVYIPELIFSNFNFYDEVHCGRPDRGGSRLTNIFSTEFVIETADGSNKYKQVFKHNMDTISVPEVTECKANEKWTKVTFKPDLAKFKMDELEEDIVGLMKKRVLDMAGCLGKTVKVKLNGQLIRIIKSCDDLEMKSAEMSSRPVNAIELPFRKKKALDEKTWIRKFKPVLYMEYPDKLLNYKYIFNKELKLFSRADLQRSIPSMVDGLKRGQRKVLFCSFKKKLCNPINVGKFIGYVSKHSAYHHCQKSIASTIIGMAQDFVGSNNINLLKPIGLFCTPNLGGKDHASASDIYTKLNPVTRYLFHENDDKLLEYLTEDKRSIEPNWYIPIIPLVLVNGSSENIGTGWTSYIANYNPKQIIANVKRWLNGEDMVPMKPWYRGFNGKIEKSDKKGVYKVSGTWDYIEDDLTLRITELPIRKSTQDYMKYLESITNGSPNEKFALLEDVIRYGYQNLKIRMKSDRKDMIMKDGLEKRFKLTTTISTSNMYLLDAEGKIKKFDSPEQILKEFIPLRLKYYEKRKEYILANLTRLMCLLDNILKLILQVLNGETIIKNRKKAGFLMELKREGFTPMPRNGKSTSTEPQVTGENGDNSEALEDDYEYLLSLPVTILFFKSARKLLAEMKEMKKQFDVLKATPPSSLWMDDLNELGKKLDEIGGFQEEEEESERSSRAGKKTANDFATKAEKKPPQPRKNDNTSVEVENEQKGRAGSKKTQKDSADDDILSLQKFLDAYNFKPSGGKTGALETEEPPLPADDDILSLQKSLEEFLDACNYKPSGEKTGALETEEPPLPADDDVLSLQKSLEEFLDECNFKPSGEKIGALETEEPPLPDGKKQNNRKGGAKKTTTVVLDTDSENEVGDFEVVVQQPAPEAGKMKVGRNLGTKRKLGPMMLQPAEGTGTSPEKKVRKMRESPFNKKSGSILGRAADKDLSLSEDSSSDSGSFTRYALNNEELFIDFEDED